MTINWTPLRSELSTWRTQRLSLPLWWRDDDATQDTPALRKLLALGDKIELPVHLAVVPKPATQDLAALCADTPSAIPVIHGWAHLNHAPTGQKKAEFGHPRPGATQETQKALSRLRYLFGERLFEMFVPPWNRIDDCVVQNLQADGYVALSTFTPRRTRLTAGVAVINTHIDPINWKSGAGLVDPTQILSHLVGQLQDRRNGISDAAEPLGFLSHHLVHDDAIWSFTEMLLSELLQGGAVPCNLQKMKEKLP